MDATPGSTQNRGMFTSPYECCPFCGTEMSSTGCPRCAHTVIVPTSSVIAPGMTVFIPVSTIAYPKTCGFIPCRCGTSLPCHGVVR